MARRIAYIVNPAAAAGRAAARWADLQPRLARLGLSGNAVYTREPNHAAGLAQASAAEGMDLVVAVGGDGTVREVASGTLAAGGQVPVALIPLGTGNDFARQMGLGDVPGAIAALHRGQTRRVDAIVVSCREDGVPWTRHALVFAAVGFAGELLRWTTARVKRWFGSRLCYSVGFARALATYRAPAAVVRTDAAQFTGRWLHIGAGNAEWAGGGALRMSPGAHWDDGQLDICLIEAMSRAAIVWNFPKLVRGTFVGHPRVQYFRGERLEIVTERPEPLLLDGDQAGCTPATLAIRPRCLAVVAPPGADVEPI